MKKKSWGSNHIRKIYFKTRQKRHSDSTSGHSSEENETLETLILTIICTPIFTEALSTITKIWKQPRIAKKEVYTCTHTGILLRHEKLKYYHLRQRR